MKTIKNIVYFIPLILLTVFVLFKSLNFEIHDFSNYYFGGYFFGKNQFDSQFYFPYHFNKSIANLGYENIFVNFAPNTPFLSVLFYPITFFEVSIAKLLFNILSVFLFVYSVFKLSNKIQIKKEYLLIIPILFYIPIKNNILFGQLYFLLFFLLSEGYIAYTKGRLLKMSLLWSLAIFIKVFPIFLGFYLLFKKDLKALFYLVLTCSVFLILSIALNGLDVWMFYFKDVLLRANNGEIAGRFVDNFQSFYMFFKRLFVLDEIYNSSVLIHDPNLFRVLLITLKVFVLGVGFYISKSYKNDFLNFAIWLMTSVFISPYGSTYTFVILIFLFLAIVKSANVKSKFIYIICLFLISNITYFNFSIFPFNYLRLLTFIILFVLIINQLKENIPFTKILMTTFLVGFIFYFIPVKEEENCTYFFKSKTPLLMYDYQIENDKLTYRYWNSSGENNKKENISYSKLDSSQVFVKENQVYYKGKQLTFNNSNKLKPILLDNKIIYLTDEDRGIGFYTLKEINLN